MKLTRILFLLTAASLGVTHAATLCCDLAGSGDALGILHEGAGNATLSVSSSFAGSGSIVHATDWLALGSAGSPILSGGRLVSVAPVWNSGSVFVWDLGATSGNPINFDDPNWSVVSGGSIGVMTSPWESVFNLTAPTTVVSGAVPEPSSVAISALLVGAGLLRRRRVV